MAEGDQTRFNKMGEEPCHGALMPSGAEAVSSLVHRDPKVGLAPIMRLFITLVMDPWHFN